LVAPESTTQSVTDVAGVDAVELRQSARDYGSHSPNHGDEGLTWCTGKPHWGVARKACGDD
jgi:hypothetical protein